MEWKTNEESISQLQWCSHRLLGRTNETCETMMCVLCLFFFCFCFFFSLYAFFRVCARLNTHYNHIYRWIPLFGLKNRARTHTRTHEHMVHNSCMRLSRDTFVVHYVAVCGECGGGVAAVARRTWYTYLYNVNADDIHSIVYFRAPLLANINRMWSITWMHACFHCKRTIFSSVYFTRASSINSFIMLCANEVWMAAHAGDGIAYTQTMNAVLRSKCDCSVLCVRTKTILDIRVDIAWLQWYIEI